MNKRQTKKLQKHSTKEIKTAVLPESAQAKPAPKAADASIPDRVFVTRNSHANYPYALIDGEHKLIANLVKISDARNHYKQELKDNRIEIIRKLDFTYGA